MREAKVKWWNDSKGYGFLSVGGERDVYAHYTAVQCDGFKTLNDGETVSVEVVEGPKGPQAGRVWRDSGERATKYADAGAFERFLEREGGS